MSIRSVFAWSLLCCLWIACKQDQTKAVEEGTAPPKSKIAALPVLGQAEIQQLLATTETVDMIFFYLPISVSQDDAASAKNSVMYISPSSPTVADTCKAAGRLSWMSQGTILREADFYLGTGCHQFVFIENNQAVYRNAMSPEAIQFFDNIIQQVKQKSNQ